MERNIIGARIEHLRKESGQTQKEVADAIGVKRETVNQWESGTRDLKTGAIIALAKHFHVTSDYILGLSDAKTTDADLKAVCDYTGLSEETAECLADDSLMASTINLFVGSFYGTMFLNSMSMFLKETMTCRELLERHCITEDSEAIANDLIKARGSQLDFERDNCDLLFTAVSDFSKSHGIDSDAVDLMAYQALKWFHLFTEDRGYTRQFVEYRGKLCNAVAQKYREITKQRKET